MFRHPRIYFHYFKNDDLMRRIIKQCSRGYASEKAKVVWAERIFSGIQPSGTLHLGNYFGAVTNWVTLQEEGHNVMYSIADLHSMTLPWEPEELNSNIMLTAASLLACGIDPTKSILFQQSRVHEHAELCWLLSCLSTMARLSHLPQYKEKMTTVKDVPLGLFSYPVLQAADILLYKATHVPVGEDQEQHLQVAQTLARMFNGRFGMTFPQPNALINGNESSRIRSLREPNRKMSKSHSDQKSRIELTDTPDKILEKIKKAVTDFTSSVTYEPEKRPGVANLIVLHSLATNKTCEEICSENVNMDTGRYKRAVADALISLINPIRENIDRFLASPEYLEDVLDEGAVKATEIAEKTWLEVKQRVGIELRHKKRQSDKTASTYHKTV